MGMRLLNYFIGSLILTLGSSLIVTSTVGASTWYALFVGLQNNIGLTVGSWVIIIAPILIIINMILTKEKPDLLGMLTVVVQGAFADFWLIFVLDDIVLTSIIMKYVVMLIGIIFVAFGVVTYLKAKFATHPIDGFMLAIMKVAKVNFFKAKTIMEVLVCIAAFLVGGPIGVGTLCSFFLTGVFIQFFSGLKIKNKLPVEVTPVNS